MEDSAFHLLAPGVYDDVSEEQYFALPYASNSRLTLLKRSPAHMKADMEQPRQETEALFLGTAIHSAVLQPDEFARRYIVSGPCEALLKSGDRKGEPCGNNGGSRHAGAWFCGKHAPDTAPDAAIALSPKQWDTCIGVRSSMYAHAKLRRMLLARGRAELTVIWDDRETGVRCKARVDRLVEDFDGVVLDLKSTTDARPEEFERTIFTRGYYRQLGLYQDGLAAHGIAMKHLVIAACEKEAPFAVAGFRLSDGAADAGRDELRRLLRLYAECQQTGTWPAYAANIHELSLPAWAWTKLEAEAA